MLPHLVLRTLRTVAWVALIGSMVGTGAATVRLMPWLVAPDVPSIVSFAFLRSLVLAALEVALFVAIPIGTALEAARWSADGTAATLQTLGVGPTRQAANPAIVAFGASLLCWVVSTESAVVAETPGTLSNELIGAAAIDACLEGRPARVPLAEVTWLCPHASPRLAGRIPSSGPARMAWTAAGATFSQDLDRIELDDVRWTVAKPSISIHAKQVVLTGFVPWIVAPRNPPGLRGATTAIVAWFASLASVWALLRWPSPSRARALAVAVSGTLGFLLIGARLVQWASWGSLPILVVIASAAPIALGRVTAFARLPGTLAGGTKRDAGRKPKTGNPDG